jgi:pilus assembly protein CpaB
MRKGNLYILLMAVVMGGIAAYLASNWIAAHANRETEQFGTIVVAAKPLAFGTVLSRENVSEIRWPEGVPEGAYTTKNELFKDGRRVALTPLQRNELILKSRITGPGQRATLSALLEEGKRAVTVRVDDVRGVAGFVLPGDRVDVILTRHVTDSGVKPENVSDVLLQHVKVLAVDQLVNERQESPTVAKAVTLEVDTDQAQKIILATDIGKLSLILRQAGESNPVPAERVTERDLTHEKRVVAPSAPAPAAAPRSNSATVSIIRNMKREEYTVMRSSN